MSDYSKSPLRSNLGRVRGLGSAKSGFHHWWLERLTAIALVPLCVWFVIALVTKLLGASPAGIADWLSNPLVALALAALALIAFIHTRMGIQVIIEDYVHTERTKIILLLFKDLCVFGLLAVTLASIARLHFIGI